MLKAVLKIKNLQKLGQAMINWLYFGQYKVYLFIFCFLVSELVF